MLSQVHDGSLTTHAETLGADRDFEDRTKTVLQDRPGATPVAGPMTWGHFLANDHGVISWQRAAFFEADSLRMRSYPVYVERDWEPVVQVEVKVPGTSVWRHLPQRAEIRQVLSEPISPSERLRARVNESRRPIQMDRSAHL